MNLQILVFGGKVPLLTEHLLSPAPVNRFKNESEFEGLINSDLACEKKAKLIGLKSGKAAFL